MEQCHAQLTPFPKVGDDLHHLGMIFGHFWRFSAPICINSAIFGPDFRRFSATKIVKSLNRIYILRSKTFFYLMFLNFAIEFKPQFKNRNWNYLNRKWTYFSYFLTSYQKSSFIKYFQLLPTSLKLVLKKEMELSILFTDLRSKILLHNVFWVKKFLGKKFLA